MPRLIHLIYLALFLKICLFLLPREVILCLMVSFMIRLMELQWDLLWVQFLQTFLCAMEKSLSLVVPGLNCVEVIQLFREGEGAPKAPPPSLDRFKWWNWGSTSLRQGIAPWAQGMSAIEIKLFLLLLLWLWNPLDSFVKCFCYLFWTWPCTTFNSIPSISDLLTRTNIALIDSVTIWDQKPKNCVQSGSFKHKLQHSCFQLWCLPAFITSFLH